MPFLMVLMIANVLGASVGALARGRRLDPGRNFPAAAGRASSVHPRETPRCA